MLGAVSIRCSTAAAMQALAAELLASNSIAADLLDSVKASVMCRFTNLWGVQATGPSRPERWQTEYDWQPWNHPCNSAIRGST
jgi:hypothetical protein